MSLRIAKVNELIRREVSQILLKEVDFGGILVTITGVDTSPDLSQAKIKTTVIPTEKSDIVFEIIRKNIFDVQQELNKRLYMKIVPKMVFEIDKVEENAQRVKEVLGKVEKVEK